MKDQHTLTILLRDARSALGFDVVRSFLPEILHLMVDSHDTGCQCRIYSGEMFTDDYVPVWEGSVWYSYSYEFNDRGKVLGLHPQAEFAEAIVEVFFEAVETAYTNQQMNRVARNVEAEEDARQKRQVAVDALRGKLTGKN
jgi:hypothetical protein